jgi:hypothetical protein
MVLVEKRCGRLLDARPEHRAPPRRLLHFTYAAIVDWDEDEFPETGFEVWIPYWSIIAFSALTPLVSAYALARWRQSHHDRRREPTST